jgi:hypothetical protein
MFRKRAASFPPVSPLALSSRKLNHSVACEGMAQLRDLMEDRTLIEYLKKLKFILYKPSKLLIVRGNDVGQKLNL